MNQISIENITEENIAKVLDVYFKENYRRINFLTQQEIMEELKITTRYKYFKYMQIYTKYFDIPFFRFYGSKSCKT